MPLPSFAILLLDSGSHALLFADGPSGEIIAEIPLPTGYAAVDLAPGPRPGQVFVTLASHAGTGILCEIDLTARTAETLSPVLPHPAHFALSADGLTGHLADPAGALYAFDLGAATVTAWDKPAGALACVGLAAAGNEISGVWETDGGGLFASYTPGGALIHTCRLGGIPTGLSAGRDAFIIPFTASPFSGEGLAVLPRESYGPPTVIPLQCSRCAAARPAYPTHAAIAPDGRTVYVACEDSAAVSIVDLAAGAVTGAIALGRSVSRLAVTSDGRFAVASSNANADLCLIDLINRRPLAFTASRREILNPLAIIG